MTLDDYYIAVGKDVAGGDATGAARRLHEHESPGCEWTTCPLRADYIRKAQVMVDALRESEWLP